MTKDLTTGKPFFVIVSFLIPVFLGLLLQQLYSVVDTIIVGQFLGADALGGVGACGSINFLIMGSCIGLCNGFCIPISTSFGAKNHALLRKYVTNSVWLCTITAVLLLILAAPNAGRLLAAMHTTPDNFPHANAYLSIMFLGAPFTLLYNMTAGIIRSMGDSKMPLLFLMIAAVLNVLLDLMLIVLIPLGTAGAAWATVISQGISGLLCLLYMWKRLPILRLVPNDWRWDGSLVLRLLFNGIPMALQYTVTAVGSVMLQSAINGLGATYVNAYAAAGRINALLISPVQAIDPTLATYVGQNTGAKRLNRIRTGMRASVLLGFALCLVYVSIAWLFTPQLTTLFLGNAEPALIQLIRQFLLTAGISTSLLGLLHTYRPSIQSMGYSGLAILSGFMEMIARALAALILIPRLGYFGACLGDTFVAWLLSSLYVIPMAYVCLHRLQKRLNRQPSGSTV